MLISDQSQIQGRQKNIFNQFLNTGMVVIAEYFLHGSRLKGFFEKSVFQKKGNKAKYESSYKGTL